MYERLSVRDNFSKSQRKTAHNQMLGRGTVIEVLQKS